MITPEEYDSLAEYSSLDGTEIGGYVCSLLNLRDHTPCHGMTEEVSDSLDEELRQWLRRFREETRIEETTFPRPDEVYKELVWLGEEYE